MLVPLEAIVLSLVLQEGLRKKMETSQIVLSLYLLSADAAVSYLAFVFPILHPVFPSAFRRRSPTGVLLRTVWEIQCHGAGAPRPQLGGLV